MKRARSPVEEPFGTDALREVEDGGLFGPCDGRPADVIHIGVSRTYKHASQSGERKRRRKILTYRESFASAWFWRPRTGAEIDYVEEEDGRLRGYEMKYGSKAPRPPSAWGRTYPGSRYAVVNRATWLAFVLGEDAAPPG